MAKMKKVKGKSTTAVPMDNYKPSIYFDNRQLPNLKVKGVGGRLTVQISGTVRSISQRMDSDRKKRTEYTLEIDKMGTQKDKK